MRWDDLTWMELDRVDRSTPVVLNIASIEQHGPHLPVSTDSLIGGFFVEELSRRLGDEVMVLPQVKVCCSAHHMQFPGTLSVSHETLLAYVCEMLELVVAHGFRNLVLVNSHGGNRAIGQVILEKFGAAHPDCRVVFLTWWHMAADRLAAIREFGFAGSRARLRVRNRDRDACRARLGQNRPDSRAELCPNLCLGRFRT